MKKIILILLMLLSSSVFGQPLGIDRIKKLRTSVVRILIDNQPSGTGFFISKEGYLLTCWHVIEPSLIRNDKGTLIGFKNITLEYASGYKDTAGILLALLEDAQKYKECLIYDYCILRSLDTTYEYDYLPMGNFNDLQEGEMIYTCGYPLGIKQQFISQGIVSTTYVDTISFYTDNVVKDKIPRNQALLDLTLNKGNSGGPIIKRGEFPNPDVVVGIADFIITPAGVSIQELNQLTSYNDGSEVTVIGIPQKGSMRAISETLLNISVGISGCVSINHFSNAWMKRQ